MSLFRRVFLLKNFKKNINFVRNFSSGGANILESPHPEVEIPDVRLPEFVFDKIGSYSKYLATECGITGRKYTYEELTQNSINLGKSLRKKLKLAPKDVVAIFLPNVPEYPVVVLGSLSSGLVVTTLNPLYTAEEIARQLEDSSAQIIFTIPELHETTQRAINSLRRNIPIILIKNKKEQLFAEGTIKFEELVQEEVDLPDLVLDGGHDLACLPYSSGTTGLPKGVELTHSNIVANLCQLQTPEVQLSQAPTESSQDIIPIVLPFFHIYGFTVCQFSMLVNGSKLVTLPKFTPETFIDALKSHKSTTIFAAPPLILFLTAHPEVLPEYFKYTRSVMSGAAPLGASDEESFLDKVGRHLSIVQGYGLTETAPVVSTTTVKMTKTLKTSGSIGKLLPNTLAKIVAVEDPSGAPLPPNTPGELLVKGPQVMRGYHKKPKETEETFQDGWLKTGDLMYYNEEGLLFVTDRLKELIKVKGFQVAPAELEAIIRSFPNVTDAAVIGVPHEIYGEVPRAFVVAKSNVLDEDKLKDFVAQKVAKYKQLEGGVEVVQSVPKNASGKILRRQIKLEYQKRVSV